MFVVHLVERSECVARGTVESGTSLYFVRVPRTYIRVILLEAIIIVALVIFGRLFS
jgi:hypothetical protein